MIEDCTAIILAGGDSRRMGTDKANLLLGGQTLLQSVIATMQQVFPRIIVSVRQPRPGIDWPQICDEYAAAGPLAGLVACLDQVATPWAFAVACDMPFVVPEVIELLGRCRTPAYQAIVPVVQGHPQPMAAFYATRCQGVMQACLAAQQNGLRGVLKQLDVCYVDEAAMLDADPQLRSFFDLDTPQDVAAVLNGER
jgi:molybdopterin-guanine dinucleotide biosynthesis protein A